IGAITPSEIAVSIVAELIAHHRGRKEKIFVASMASLNKIHHRRGIEEPTPPLSPSVSSADDGD
ncbi:MAG TPA: hypothetical protein VKA63_09795, partial [Candidatus Krumholzibacteria bacterium]|nr:hypothetical protein [Candidatus Krumholzibacteria bacterium]